MSGLRQVHVLDGPKATWKGQQHDCQRVADHRNRNEPLWRADVSHGVVEPP
jgi:hypothetical protein